MTDEDGNVQDWMIEAGPPGALVRRGWTRDSVQPGTEVLVNGCGLSETVDGGYSEYARIDSRSLVAVPEGMSCAQAMQIGTAGYTAALAIHRMEQNSQTPDLGPIVVTGATGGVGSIAIDMLAGRGYEVAAVTGKAGEAA